MREPKVEPERKEDWTRQKENEKVGEKNSQTETMRELKNRDRKKTNA